MPRRVLEPMSLVDARSVARPFSPGLNRTFANGPAVRVEPLCRVPAGT